MENETENWLERFMRRLWWTYLVIGGILIGFAIGTMNMQMEAVKNEGAHFDPRTRAFTWGTIEGNAAEGLIRSNNIDLVSKCKALGKKAADRPECTLVGM